MKKIIVIGCPGSGKSTFSRKLNKITNIELTHLDILFWNSDKTTVPNNIFLERLNSVLNKEQWIIDGDYSSTMELRMKECDTIIFLDYPKDICLEGIKNRIGQKRSDLPWVETSTNEDLEFINLVKEYNIKKRPKVIELLNKYSDKNIYIFKDRIETEEFLKDI